MKNHFYIAYFGNKREEVENLYNILDFTDVKTIVEPYCGSCAMSYYIWLKRPDLKFVLNDKNSFLLDMYNILINDEKLKEFQDKVHETVDIVKVNKEEYNRVVKKNDLLGWFIGHRYYALRYGMYPDSVKRPQSWTKFNFKDFPVYDFFNKANITFTSVDGLECYNSHKKK